jgi:putative transposase
MPETCRSAGKDIRQMLAAALQAEVAAYIDQFAGLRDENGRRLVVGNGSGFLSGVRQRIE